MKKLIIKSLASGLLLLGFTNAFAAITAECTNFKVDYIYNRNYSSTIDNISFDSFEYATNDEDTVTLKSVRVHLKPIHNENITLIFSDKDRELGLSLFSVLGKRINVELKNSGVDHKTILVTNFDVSQS